MYHALSRPNFVISRAWGCESPARCEAALLIPYQRPLSRASVQSINEMSSFAQQPRAQQYNTRPAERSDREQESVAPPAHQHHPSTGSSATSSHAVQSIDLFPPNSLELRDADDWSFIVPSSPPSPASSSVSVTSAHHRRTPADFGNDSLGLPSHQGNGVFNLQDSLIVSEGAPSLYASMTMLGSPLSSASGTGTSLSLPSSSSASNRDLGPTQSRSEEDWFISSPSGSLSELSVSDEGSGSARGPTGEGAGGWALTEQSLSSLQDEALEISETIVRPPSAGLTSDSSAGEEEVQRRGRNVPRARMLNSRRYDEQEDSDEDLMFRGGLTSLYKRMDKVRGAGHDDGGRTRGSAAAYPSPPPEDISLRSRSKTGKRRHRRSGGVNGSQKRSSTSGSLSATSLSRSKVVSSIPLVPLPLVSEKPTQAELDLQVRQSYSKDVFLGPTIIKIMDVDTSTLGLLATATSTPTPSRIGSPSLSHPRNNRLPPLLSRRSKKSHHRHGFRAFSDHARDELGFGLPDPDADMMQEGEGSSTETEREGPAPSTRKGAATWYKEYRPPVTVPSSPSIFQEEDHFLHRSLSLSALPTYLAGSPIPSLSSSLLPSSTLSNSSFSAASALSNRPTQSRLLPLPSPGPSRTLRRTSSFTSGQSDSGRSNSKVHPRGGGGGGEGLNEPWGADFEGQFGLHSLTEALGYWRRFLRGWRGY